MSAEQKRREVIKHGQQTGKNKLHAGREQNKTECNEQEVKDYRCKLLCPDIAKQ